MDGEHMRGVDFVTGQLDYGDGSHLNSNGSRRLEQLFRAYIFGDRCCSETGHLSPGCKVAHSKNSNSTFAKVGNIARKVHNFLFNENTTKITNSKTDQVTQQHSNNNSDAITNLQKSCWAGGFDWNLCCHPRNGPGGNQDCWDREYFYERCCISDHNNLKWETVLPSSVSEEDYCPSETNHSASEAKWILKQYDAIPRVEIDNQNHAHQKQVAQRVCTFDNCCFVHRNQEISEFANLPTHPK